MNVRFQEKRYGGFTLEELKEMCTGPTVPKEAQVIVDLVTELESASAPEMIQRMRRLETKVHKIGVHVGAEPNAETTVTVERHGMGTPLVHVPGYDVTIAQVRRAANEAGWVAGTRMYLMQGESNIAVLSLTAHR